MKITDKKVFSLFFLVFTVIFLMANVSSWGVAGLYTEQTPLKLPPGTSEIVSFQLQNMIGDNDIKVVVTILEGSEYIEIVGPTSYIVPIGTHNTEVQFRVTAPTEEGNYPIRLSFETVSTQTGGGVAMETGMDRKFSLISTTGAVPPVTTPAEQQGTWWPYALAIAVVLVVILAIVLKSKKKKKR